MTVKLPVFLVKRKSVKKRWNHLWKNRTAILLKWFMYCLCCGVGKCKKEMTGKGDVQAALSGAYQYWLFPHQFRDAGRRAVLHWLWMQRLHGGMEFWKLGYKILVQDQRIFGACKGTEYGCIAGLKVWRHNSITGRMAKRKGGWAGGVSGQTFGDRTQCGYDGWKEGVGGLPDTLCRRKGFWKDWAGLWITGKDHKNIFGKWQYMPDAAEGYCGLCGGLDTEKPHIWVKRACVGRWIGFVKLNV